MRTAAWVAVSLLCRARRSPRRSNRKLAKSAAERLIGTWTIDAKDEAGVKAFGPCTMEFKRDGHVVDSVPEGKILLTYRVEGFTPEGNLVLEIEGQRARFLKQSTSAR